MTAGLSRHERTALVIGGLIAAAVIVAAAFRPETPQDVPQPELPRFHADSIEALRWQRTTYLDSMRRHLTDTVIIPYKALFEEYADSSGFDWQLLAAMAYQESRFDAHARSRAGATGLMQLMPSTFREFGTEDPENPAESVKAGAKRLLSIKKRFSRLTADSEEALRFTLAAYNAGPGRIKMCIDTLQARGIEVCSWDDIATSLPEIEDFKGVETTIFVDKVMAVYRSFKKIE